MVAVSKTHHQHTGRTRERMPEGNSSGKPSKRGGCPSRKPLPAPTPFPISRVQAGGRPPPRPRPDTNGKRKGRPATDGPLPGEKGRCALTKTGGSPSAPERTTDRRQGAGILFPDMRGGGVSIQPPAASCQCPVQASGHTCQASLAKTLARDNGESFSGRSRILRKGCVPAPRQETALCLASDEVDFGALHQPMRGLSHVISGDGSL